MIYYTAVLGAACAITVAYTALMRVAFIFAYREEKGIACNGHTEAAQASAFLLTLGASCIGWYAAVYGTVGYDFIKALFFYLQTVIFLNFWVNVLVAQVVAWWCGYQEHKQYMVTYAMSAFVSLLVVQFCATLAIALFVFIDSLM